jgi:hypothetical protein
MNLRIEGFEFFSHPTRTRFPFRYGIASMTEVPHLFVQVHAVVNDHGMIGLASEGLPPKWFTKDPDTTFERDLVDMFAVIGHAAALMTQAGKQPRSFHQLWRDVYTAQSEWAFRTGKPPLLANLGVSLCERAVLDAFCRSLEMPAHRVIRENRVGMVLRDIHPALGNAEPRDFLPAQPLNSIMVRHTLGLTDPLTPGDIPEAERVRDGLPQDLQGCIRAYGLRAFKVKLSGKPDRDLARLRALSDLLRQETDGEFILTLDANENFSDFAGFRGFWSHVTGDPGLENILSRTIAVEQPVHRTHALSNEVREALNDWSEHPPLIIDESDGALEDLPRALELGYQGSSHKNCKGILKGIANACLLEHRRRAGRNAILTGEDLCNLGPIALLQDLALMTLLGIRHVERNGHHYYRGLSPWPEEWQNLAHHAHPDLYTRDAQGLVRLDVQRGHVQLASINEAPFGLKPLFDPSRFAQVRLPTGR